MGWAEKVGDMEPWREQEKERVAQVGKDEAFLGNGLKAGPREEGTGVSQTSRVPGGEGKSIS